MKIELIPVIEINNYEQDVPMPPHGPYWKFPIDWENYRVQANLEAGFSKSLKPYSKGTSLYQINDISNADLLKVIHKEIKTQQTEENLGIEDLVLPFYGGYILKIEGIDKYFPQCCSDLGDITEWNDLLDNEDYNFYMGHPSPRIEKFQNTIIFDFLNSEIQENYSPPILEDQIAVDKNELANAIEDAKKELKIFAEKLILINESENLNIPNIENILIYGSD
ncbi:hypothetical protein [Chryseobacterium turcicum]|uniref:Uncharacterized protein n=1 Tax=Chryseobacterium turcicum TaxID=2898076 RepID=A0A9Q3V4D9_9FLAO|nr:hypothetical protein [Chryseobacterium turcicum]MCD1118162.1 hypothetical protein [Chryseobacterium turcicum]